MGFNSVYRVLQEVFPQVDTRLLRAVAIEHSKDADTAVEIVLVEIIPFLPKGTPSSVLPTAMNSSYQPSRVEDKCHVHETDGTVAGSPNFDTMDDSEQVCGGNGNEELVELGKLVKEDADLGPVVTATGILINENRADDDCNQVHGNAESEEVTTLQDPSTVHVGSNQGSQVLSTTSKDGNCNDGTKDGTLLVDLEDFDVLSLSVSNTVIHGQGGQNQACCCQLKVENSATQLASPPVEECTPTTQEDAHQLAVDSTLNSNNERPETNDKCNSASEKDICSSGMNGFGEEPALDTVVTRSGQICRIDLLEDIIEDARNNKKTLFSMMESVISLMREVELQEKAAEQAKEEAVRGGLDALTRVEDLKQMLQHAKEANEMHAGEVYGERAILATEMRELQSRLLSLSDERDKSLAILDEMHQTLQERLEAAEKERREAEQDKMEKEESTRCALAEQQIIMEKVVQESEILKQESEENSKLREFLMDRGRVVDMLQGEISVICQDVKLLKEKFDERVPLSKSLSSSQTSCILASSSSSLKSLADQVPEQAELSESPKGTSRSPSADYQVSLGNGSKTLVEDGWEIFERELCM